MKILLTIISILLFSIMVYAQEESQFCGSVAPTEAWENAFQKLISADRAAQKGQTDFSKNYVVPVVFHVVHGGEPIGTFPNILQGQIHAQLTILNQDFSGNAYNSSNYPLNAFVNWAVNQNIPSTNLDQHGRIKIADFNIQFCLATTDPNGNYMPEPGIDRINYLSLSLPSPSSYSTQTTMKSYLDKVLKPKTIWDVTKYLNVWITDKNTALTYSGVSSGPPLSGLMDLPNNATDSTDGIWCFTKVIGSYSLFPGGSYLSPFTDGRILTHEAGHYVGLRHIWGETDCGNDFCTDTPPAAGSNSGTPTYPHGAGSCASPSNNPDGEMFMNFMDYSRGQSVYMFTTDQKTRAHTAMQNSPFRNQLGTHGLCSATTGLNDETFNSTISIYPNPSNSIIHIRNLQNDIYKIYISNLMGQVLIQTDKNAIDVSNLANGIYILTIKEGQNHHALRFIKESR